MASATKTRSQTATALRLADVQKVDERAEQLKATVEADSVRRAELTAAIEHLIAERGCVDQHLRSGETDAQRHAEVLQVRPSPPEDSRLEAVATAARAKQQVRREEAGELASLALASAKRVDQALRRLAGEVETYSRLCYSLAAFRDVHNRTHSMLANSLDFRAAFAAAGGNHLCSLFEVPILSGMERSMASAVYSQLQPLLSSDSQGTP